MRYAGAGGVLSEVSAVGVALPGGAVQEVVSGWIWDSGAWSEVFSSGPALRMMSFTSGGQGQTVAADVTAGFSGGIGFRVPVKLWDDTTRWRVRLRNYDMTGVAQDPLSATGLVFGEHAGSGVFSGSAATSLAGSFTIPGDGSFYASPWVTDPAEQLAAGTEYLFGLHYAASWNTKIKTIIGECFQSSTGTNAIVPSSTSGLSVPSGIPVDFIIEYEASTRSHGGAWLVVGDSIQEGVQGPAGTSGSSITPRPIHESPPQQWANGAGVLVENISMAGMTAAIFAQDATYPEFWTRQDLADSFLSGALVSLGSNDVSSSRSSSEVQADITAVVSRVREVLPSGAPVYLGTIMPRNALTSGQNAVRESVNAWIRGNPLGAAGYVDFDAVMKSSSNAANLDPALTCDRIHPSYAGVTAMVGAMASTIVV